MRHACICTIALFIAMAISGEWDDTYKGYENRISIKNNENKDILVTECWFRDVSDSGNGGAIYMWHYGNFRVQSSLFQRCSSGRDGGAVWADTNWVDILSSCVTECLSAGDGSVLCCDPDNGNSDCYDDSFLGTVSKASGSVFGTDKVNLQFARVNFTACEAFTRGSAIATRDPTLTFNASHLILLALRGSTPIDSHCGSVLAVSQCNFYENLMSEGGAVLWGDSHGLSLSECIFRNNAGNRLIGMTNTPSASNRFAFTNCVFDADYPSNADLASIGPGCHSNSETVSHEIYGVVGFGECPTNSPTATASHTPTETASHTPSGTPSSLFRPSSPIMYTDAHDLTITLLLSRLLLPTHRQFATRAYHWTGRLFLISRVLPPTRDQSATASFPNSVIWVRSSIMNPSAQFANGSVDFFLESQPLSASVAFDASLCSEVTALVGSQFLPNSNPLSVSFKTCATGVWSASQLANASQGFASAGVGCLGGSQFSRISTAFSASAVIAHSNALSQTKSMAHASPTDDGSREVAISTVLVIVGGALCAVLVVVALALFIRRCRAQRSTYVVSQASDGLFEMTGPSFTESFAANTSSNPVTQLTLTAGTAVDPWINDLDELHR
jgi:hypothetical protein